LTTIAGSLHIFSHGIQDPRHAADKCRGGREPAMIAFSAPLAGMHAATEALARTAARVASAGAPSGDSVDLSQEMIALILARHLFAANARIMRAEAEVSQALLDILA
jgi:hypothetical protein